MNDLQNMKLVQLIADMTVDNAAFTTTEIDTLGYAYAEIAASFGNVPANVAAMTVTESDTAGSGHAAFITVGTTTDITGTATALPTAASGDGKTVLFQIDMRGRKRYLDLTVTAGDGSGTATECSAVCRLYKSAVGPRTATECGVTYIVRL